MTNLIINTARSWLGTKFHHQGRVKHIGVDCIGLVLGVARELQIELPDAVGYARQPDESELLAGMQENLQECALQAGAIGLFSINNRAQHVGIITDYNGLGVIHAYMQARKVVEHSLDEFWQAKLIRCFAFPPPLFETLPEA